MRWANIPQLSASHAPCPAAWLQRWLQSRRPGADPRPSAFRPDISPRSRGSSERYALLVAAADSGWLLLLLSAAVPGPRLRGLPGAATAPCPVPGPSPEPDSCRTTRQTGSVKGRRSRSRVTPKAPLTGSGCREHSYGGSGGGYPPSTHSPAASTAISSLSAWELDRSWPITSVIRQLMRPGLAVIDRLLPWLISH